MSYNEMNNNYSALEEIIDKLSKFKFIFFRT